ncbi:MAG: hypothetical protein ACRDN0_13610, partial [Trebonia sp.]
ASRVRRAAPVREPSAKDTPAGRHAARLLRWYPESWRARYGDEFTELLISDIEERPRSAARTLDVARGGIVARLTAAGLAGFQASWADTGETADVSAVTRHVTASLVSLGARRPFSWALARPCGRSSPSAGSGRTRSPGPWRGQ